ncbi:beta-ketoacyl synthase [Hypoxylon crocopeplum]|nr:beta-ketoacyl synthase [Hypoxylon crocopeplum]
MASFLHRNGLDGKEDDDPIAICGFSIKFPGDAVSVDSFWQMLIEKRCAMTEFPMSRFNKNGFYQKGKGLSTIPVPGGHFVQEDLSVFDADFFSISPAESAAVDPMQRWLLETAYRALENAGITMDSVSGSSTSAYTGSFGLDYGIQLNRDVECPPLHAGLGFGISMLANRLSWFFDFRGPSIGLDSACSSSAMAIDMACQSLRNGSCDMSLFAGCNLMFAPETYTWLSNLNFLSADGKCYPFDHRANGYSRGGNCRHGPKTNIRRHP